MGFKALEPTTPNPPPLSFPFLSNMVDLPPLLSTLKRLSCKNQKIKKKKNKIREKQIKFFFLVHFSGLVGFCQCRRTESYFLSKRLVVVYTLALYFHHLFRRIFILFYFYFFFFIFFFFFETLFPIILVGLAQTKYSFFTNNGGEQFNTVCGFKSPRERGEG